MVVVNYSTFRNNLKDYCDLTTENGETVIVTRKDEKNIVILSLEQYNEIMRQVNNNRYLNMLQKSIDEYKNGDVVVKNIEEL